MMPPSAPRRHPARPRGARSERVDALRWALCAFIIIVISTVHVYVPIIAMMRPGVLLWLFIVVYPVLVPSSLAWSNIRSSWPPRMLAVLFVCAILSVPFGISMGQAGTFFIDVYSRVLLFAIVLILAIRTVRELSFLVWAYTASIGVLTVLAFTVMRIDAVPGGIQRLQGDHMYDSNDMGVLFNVGLPLALLNYETATSRVGKLVSIGLLVGIPATIARFGSRGAFLGLLGVGLTLLFSARHVSVAKRLLVVPVAAAALALAAPPGYWDQMNTIFEPGDDYNLTDVNGRKAIAERGMKYMASYPVFGLGISNFGRAEGTISERARSGIPGVGIKWLAPHNTYIQVGAEMGVIALGAWIALLFGSAIGIARYRSRIPPRWKSGTRDQRFLYLAGIYFPAAIVGFALPSVFVSHTYLPQFYILVAYAAAFFTLTERELRRGASGPRRPAGRPPVPRAFILPPEAPLPGRGPMADDLLQVPR